MINWPGRGAAIHIDAVVIATILQFKHITKIVTQVRLETMLCAINRVIDATCRY